MGGVVPLSKDDVMVVHKKSSLVLTQKDGSRRKFPSVETQSVVGVGRLREIKKGLKEELWLMVMHERPDNLGCRRRMQEIVDRWLGGEHLK